MKLDNELEALARHALCEAFWRDFSALCNTYLEAAEGLDVDTLTMQMGDKTNIYGRDTKAEGDISLNIWTQNGESNFSTTGHETLLEAFEYEPAKEIHLGGERVFNKVHGEWYFYDGEAA